SPEGPPVRIIRANIDPPGKDVRTDYNVEWVDICLLREVNLNGFVVQHTVNPDTTAEAIATFHTFSETGVLPAGTIVRLHSGSRLQHDNPEPDLVHRYVAADTGTGNWRLNNRRETIRILDAAGAVQDTRTFLPGSLVAIDAGAVSLVARPAETPECPTPGVPADCLPPVNTYWFSRMREGYRLEVGCERPAAYTNPPACEDLERMVCEGAPAPWPPTVSEADNCVVLATIQVLGDGIIVVDDLSDRRQLLSPWLLQEYLRCRCETLPEPPPPTTPPTIPTVFTRPTVFTL